MTQVVEATDTHVLLEDADGDRRFVLVKCPACGELLAGAEHHPEIDIGPVLSGRSTATHLLADHGPECFGLGTLERESYQARLTGVVSSD